MIEVNHLMVIKKNGEFSAFDSQKILSKIFDAERGQSSVLGEERKDRLERIVILIENEIYNCFEETIPVEEVQRIVEDRLTDLKEHALAKKMKKQGEMNEKRQGKKFI